MRKIDHSRRQFMKTASYAAMAGVTASPLLHSMRALAAMSSHAASAATGLPRHGLRLPAGRQ